MSSVDDNMPNHITSAMCSTGFVLLVLAHPGHRDRVQLITECMPGRLQASDDIPCVDVSFEVSRQTWAGAAKQSSQNQLMVFAMLILTSNAPEVGWHMNDAPSMMIGQHLNFALRHCSWMVAKSSQRRPQVQLKEKSKYKNPSDASADGEEGIRKGMLSRLATRLVNALTQLLRKKSKTEGNSSAPLLTDTCGSQPLMPQPIPDFLVGYHETSVAFSEAALADATLSCTRRLLYGTDAHQTLDVWAPASGGAGLPIVVGIHGGGWEVGYTEWAGFPACHVCAAPALYITPAYTLGNLSRQAWPSSRNDLLAALRWVSEHAAEFGGDPSRIILTGHSAGAHLASCLGLNPDLLREASISPEAIKALFLVSGPIGLRAQDFLPRWLWRLWPVRLLFQLLYRRILPNFRAVVGDPPDPAVVEEASALATICRADAKSLPGLIHLTYGKKGDFPICGPQAKHLQMLLKDMTGGPRVEILEMLEANHFDTHWALNDGGSEWHAALRKALHNV